MLQFWFRKSLKQPTWLIPVLIVLLATLLLNLRAQQVQRETLATWLDQLSSEQAGFANVERRLSDLKTARARAQIDALEGLSKLSQRQYAALDGESGQAYMRLVPKKLVAAQAYEREFYEWPLKVTKQALSQDANYYARLMKANDHLELEEASTLYPNNLLLPTQTLMAGLVGALVAQLFGLQLLTDRLRADRAIWILVNRDRARIIGGQLAVGLVAVALVVGSVFAMSRGFSATLGGPWLSFDAGQTNWAYPLVHAPMTQVITTRLTGFGLFAGVSLAVLQSALWRTTHPVRMTAVVGTGWLLATLVTDLWPALQVGWNPAAWLLVSRLTWSAPLTMGMIVAGCWGVTARRFVRGQAVV